MSGFLEKILRTTRSDLEARKVTRGLEEVRSAAAPRPPGVFLDAITAPGLSVIAEVKRASPSKGDIRPDLRVEEIVRAYESGGARAISVLTEERYFKGSLADLRQARSSTALPILRKDFIVDPYQIWEAAEAGADAVLLIVAALPPLELESLMSVAREAGLGALVEVHASAELEIAASAGADIIGINNRNLSTFSVNLETTLNLLESVPQGCATVSESGIRNREDAALLDDAGVDAILVGETLMRSPDPGKKLRQLITP